MKQPQYADRTHESNGLHIMTTHYPTISLCMIAKNEEQYIASAIESVKSIVSEIILVDTGSTDNTCEIARSLGAKVYSQPWQEDFSAPRNLSLELASMDWILVLDADEIIHQDDLAKIQNLTLDRSSCFEFVQRHYSNDHRLSSFRPVTGEYPELERHYGGFFESKLVRLFPNREGIEYIGRVHELVEHSVRRIGRHTVVNSEIRLHHYGHTPEVREKKNKGSIYTPLGQAKLSDDPKNWQAYFELGVEHNNNGQINESIAAFMKSVEMNPRYVPTWVNLGYVLCEAGMYKEAVHSLQSAINLEPNSGEAFCNLGVVYLRVRQFPTAEKYFLRAIALEPTYVNAYCNLGKALTYQGKISEAVHFYKRALEMLPLCTAALLDLGAIYNATKQYSLAEEYLSAAEKNDKGNVLLKYHLAQVFSATKKIDKALEHFSAVCRALEEAPQPHSMEMVSMLESVKMEKALLERERV